MLTYVVRRLPLQHPSADCRELPDVHTVVLASDLFAQLEMNRNVSLETIARVKEQAMNDPFIVRYGYWPRRPSPISSARRSRRSA